MLTRIGARARSWAAARTPWTNVYGLVRTLLALGTVTTLLFTHSGYLFQPAGGMPYAPVCTGTRAIGAFCVGSAHLEIARWLMVAALLVIASGWRPRLTALPHWWIAFSLANNAIVVDGGDQVTLVLATLLLPVALTDRRTWHWGRPEEPFARMTAWAESRRIIALFALTLVRIQVAAIYFHAAIGKLGVEEWVDGTAVYYFFHDPTFGGTPAVMAVLGPILRNPVGVCLISWGTVMLEYVLSAALFMPRRYQRPLLAAGIALHAGIILVHGLVSFALAMFAALIIYLRPVESVFSFDRMAAWARNLRTPTTPPEFLTTITETSS